MSNIIKAAVAAVAVAGSLALMPAQALAAHHRHPAHAYQGEPRYPQFESRDVYLPSLSVPGPAEEQWFDRATQSFGGGK